MDCTPDASGGKRPTLAYASIAQKQVHLTEGGGLSSPRQAEGGGYV